MRHLGYYKTIEEYYDSTSGTPDNWSYVSYVRTNFETGDETIYGIKGKPSFDTIVMWIDDLEPGNTYEYPTIGEYLDAYFKAPYEFGGIKLVYSGETVEYDGDTYYVWEQEPNAANHADFICLTSIADYNTLYNLSVEANRNNRNCVIYKATLDSMEYFPEDNFDPERGEWILIKVEPYQERVRQLGMYMDDFPDGTDEGYQAYDDDWVQYFYGYQTMQDYLDDYIDDPMSFGSNYFVYYGETIEYDGDTYYLWERDEETQYACRTYVLTETADYTTLYNQSIENVGIFGQSTPAVYELRADLRTYNLGENTDKMLVKVENYQN